MRDSYIAKHQKGHTELERLGEPVAESKKVTDFLRGITDSRLETGKSVIDGDTTKLESFEECQQYMKTLVENLKARKQAGDERRTISQTSFHQKP